MIAACIYRDVVHLVFATALYAQCAVLDWSVQLKRHPHEVLQHLSTVHVMLNTH